MRSISSPSLLPVGGGRFSAVGCAPGWSVSSGFWPEEALSACAARLPGVSKSSLLPLRALVIKRNKCRSSGTSADQADDAGEKQIKPIK
ncbi:hypothetical protein F2Q69_00034911 [Brassica cretica]|uniref:Uncharacterized protein n=1 Tax=Brassica cretica TaxID=69181 RepID=A0A8S9SRB1_BRACR|nr:hypothetical protein F2Q69_00034911 [Brassica cretica]